MSVITVGFSQDMSEAVCDGSTRRKLEYAAQGNIGRPPMVMLSLAEPDKESQSLLPAHLRATNVELFLKQMDSQHYSD